MKKNIAILIIIFFTFSCSLTDSIDQDPPNNLVPENVVQNEDDARAILNGAYSKIISFSSSHYYMYSELIPSALIGSMSRVSASATDEQFSENDILFDNGTVNAFWSIFYGVIDASNTAIALTDQLPESEITLETKKEIIGEAHFIRAMATFDALRYFGQFYDTNSSLGVILRTEPVNFVTRSKSRSSVTESYDQIINDLNIAIADAPDFSVSYRASKTAARALKARVLLFMGRYAEAAALANEVIIEGTRSLSPDFTSVFDEGLDSTEMILMTYRDENSDVDDNNRKRFYPGRAGTTWFPVLMGEDPRAAVTFNAGRVLKTNNVDTFRPTYFIRLSELYLIQAEALLMSGASVETSKIPLDIIRNRAGIDNTAATTVEELKNDIFNEYVKELAFENGSEWFAAIRMNKAMELKPSITSENQYILPIPEKEIEGNELISLADQNPGY
ncbi:RagB/SusD family nutrient uptake outer membrane protein [Aquimarina algicola]|uniref:RagB/SusD family nutrient uptake outer membrane protein n=1 Tax=Aquimarina algicola TaxID=2589995 RepID=A0A504J7U7_9FLAO|nr:RagB/SusD family nutrient uptake outer membrane protein [Aquimarina algicola]TPN82770.1 RagB/SusD family nutrient uptake outer membrane protein [Aquimarina algicola]